MPWCGKAPPGPPKQTPCDQSIYNTVAYQGGGRGSLAALAQIVAVAAGIFFPHAGAFKGERLRHHVVEEGAVVADQEQCARVILQSGFQQLERFDVEVVVGSSSTRMLAGRAKRRARSRRFRSPPESIATFELARRGG